MKLAIISDTHDRREIVTNACSLLAGRRIDYILHAGDITLPATAERLARVPRQRLIAVFGNCDHEKARMKRAIAAAGGEIHTGLLKTEIEGRKIAMTHDPYNLGGSVSGGEFDLVVYGHTHEKDIRTVASTVIINPGQGGAVILDLDYMTHEAISLRNPL